VAEVVKMYIDGDWREGTSTFDARDPSTGTILGSVPQARSADIDSAVMSAKRALREWRSYGVDRRAAIVDMAATRLAELYGQQGEPTPLKQLITKEVGKRLPEADIEVIESSDMLKYFAGVAPSLLASKELQLDRELWPSKSSRVVFEPVGVTAVIKPWNYPLELPLWAIGAALVAGNTVVFKPSEHSSFVGAEIVKLFVGAGIPKGVLNLLTGDGEVGKQLVSHQDVSMVSFTGSAVVGREIAVTCAQKSRRYSLELGGNDAAIVLPDVDLELAANGLVWGAFCNSGQVCVGVKRVFAHVEIAEELTRLIAEKTEALREGVDYGPLISGVQLAKLREQVQSTIDAGAKVVCGANTADQNDGGFYYRPTVLADVPMSAPIMEHECFGPVLPIAAVDSVDEALRLANDSSYGLGASVWTSQLEEGERLADALDVGMVWVNDVNVAFPQAPWGGVKGSGPGIELSEWGILEFTNKKHVCVDLSNDVRREWWYPYE
jgi:acyl-CoA reductase-like NAD-dependent aldehyde dehydrogenase